MTDYWKELFDIRPEFQALPKKFKYKWDHFTPSEIYSLEKMWDPEFMAEMEQRNTPPLAYHPRPPQPGV